MFYYFLYPLHEYHIFFNLFRYITLRATAASITAFTISLILGPVIIKTLKRLSCSESTLREHAESLHVFSKGKENIPTMGGLLIVLSITLSTLLWANLSNRFILLSLLILLWFAAIGFLDDYLKIKKRSHKGLRKLAKLLGQASLGLILAVYLYLDPQFRGLVTVPFFKNLVVDLGFLYIPFVMMVLAGSSNALNLTDGLDGLAIGCMIIAAAAFSIIAYVSGHAIFAQYLQIPFFVESGELTVFCAAIVGASAGFLWHNAYPATIFMGDTGSLSLGGALGAIAIFTKKEFVLLIVGGIFVWEALSVILQVLSFRTRKRRIFLMSPFHHHLQLKGIPESKVTIRMWIIAFILSLCGLSTLKIR